MKPRLIIISFNKTLPFQWFQYICNNCFFQIYPNFVGEVQFLSNLLEVQRYRWKIIVENKFSEKYLRGCWQRIQVFSKVGPYRLHDLRHTFNTNMLKAGVASTVIMKLTGHKTDAMFTRYTHLDEELGTDAMKKLIAYMEGKKDKKVKPIRKKKESR